MKTILVVVNDFGDYKRGAEIDDPVEVDNVLASANALNVVARQISAVSALNYTGDTAAH